MPLFDDFFRPLQRGKHLEQYQVLDGRYIVAIDGSQYFTSEKISCPGCLIREDKKGKRPILSPDRSGRHHEPRT